MKRLLRILAVRGVLIRYTAGLYTGQTVRVWGPDGLPRNMRPGTAKAYARRIEAQEWGFR